MPQIHSFLVSLTANKGGKSKKCHFCFFYYFGVSFGDKVIPYFLHRPKGSPVFLLFFSSSCPFCISGIVQSSRYFWHEKSTSPLYGRIDIGEDQSTPIKCITIECIRIAINVGNFLSKYDRKNVLTQSFKGRTLQTVRGVWPFAQVYQHANQARVRFVKAGAGTLYYTLWQTYAPMAYSDSVNAGFEVSRSITDLQGKAVTEFKAGQRYKVTLKTRSTASRSFVVLEDFIPAGFEIVNTSLATESREQAASLNNAAWGGFERDEKYDDRIVIFADYLTEGEHEYSYLVQASVAGDFAYPSLWASQMYDPAVFGRNATSRMVIKP